MAIKYQSDLSGSPTDCSDETPELGVLLRALRESKSLSILATAKETGCSVSQLARLERGDQTNPGLDLIRKFEAAHGVSSWVILLSMSILAEVPPSDRRDVARQVLEMDLGSFEAGVRVALDSALADTENTNLVHAVRARPRAAPEIQV